MRTARKQWTEISLRPYSGRLFFAHSKQGYMRAHEKLFKTPDILTCAQAGRFTGGCGNDGLWTYLIWASDPATLAHEVAHVILDVFQRCGINPVEANGEPFCYMLSQTLLDIKATKK